MVPLCLLLAGSKRCNAVVDLTLIALKAASRLTRLQLYLLNSSFAFWFGTSQVIPYNVPVHLAVGLMRELNAEDWFKQAWSLENKVYAPCIVAEKFGEAFK